MSRYYCICRTSDGSGFMIGCERCEEWFHGRCIGIKKKEANNIEKFYCEACRRLYNDKVLYKTGEVIVKNEPKADKKLKIPKQEPLEERKQEKKVPESTSAPIQAPIPVSIPVSVSIPARVPLDKSPKKLVTGKRKGGPRAKSKATQCANAVCTRARRDISKYCSDECGYAFNKSRYDTFYRPKWAALSQNHSKARLNRMKDLEQLDKAKTEVEKLIKNLKEEKKEVEENIKTIKEQAQRMYNEQRKMEDMDESSSKNEDAEETLTGDSSKTFCITCGISILRTKVLQHWLICHRKHEDRFSVSALGKSFFEDDEDPKIFCEFQDKKTGRFCKHLEAACPIHIKWSSDKDEVCGCPLNMMQKLVPDGNYCLELKKDCQAHYHWDKFRLADINMLRIQAYSKLENIIEKRRATDDQLSDTYGGVVGVMLHNTIDHEKEEITEKQEEDENLMVDI